ncbi:MAG TPA: hypothetical protein VEU33_43710, partial [Archangium sp.]|nr:hypothetical protein [Archangium sp.]
RGVAFERDMTQVVRADTLRPKAHRQILQDFNEPLVEMYVGVYKPKAGLRFADVLVIERKPLPGQSPRVETFSFKSRDFSGMDYEAVRAQMSADARAALAYYGETLNIRRPGLEGRVKVLRVRLIYQGGALAPKPSDMEKALSATKATVPGVEVLFR